MNRPLARHTRLARRTLLAAALATPVARRAHAGMARVATARVAIVGGGFAGATIARALAAAGHQVTLVEAPGPYYACPRSNEVVAGLRDIDSQHFGWDGFARAGVTVLRTRATALDPATRDLRTEAGPIPYDRLIMAPGVDLRLDPAAGGIPGYTQSATDRMPHAWKAGPQTTLLRTQLEAMPDGGTVVISVPPAPYRCPPGPYERASLIAWYLKTNKPRSKLIVLDAKDTFSKQRLFLQAWAELYPGRLQWVSLSDGGRVTAVDPDTMTVTTEFETYTAAVANIIPPQRAASIAAACGLTDRSAWCPVDPVTFESTLIPAVHVIGDAAAMGAMPKSAFAAQQQAWTCAAAVHAVLTEQPPPQPRLVNTCWSLLAPGNAISVAGVYRPGDKTLIEVEGAGGTTPLDATNAAHAQEAVWADAWFKTITAQTFG